MLLKKTVSIVFVVVFSFVAVSAVNAQESANDVMTKFYTNLPENCQDAIKRFPANLRGGWERAYIAVNSTGQMSDDKFLSLMQSSLLTNFIKTNIILIGKGNEKVGDSNVTYSQFYQQSKVGPLGGAAMFRMLTAVTGNSGGINWDKWEQDFMEFL
jgi:hypothetical protein